MSRRFSFVLFAILPLFTFAQNQPNARNGCKYSPTDSIRILIVFADVTNDTLLSPIANWPENELPLYADSLIDENFSGSPISHISRYYNEASFGKLHITGDYYPYLLKLDTSDLNKPIYQYVRNIIDSLNDLQVSDIVTAHGHHLSDFDQWTYGFINRDYTPRQKRPDNMIDMLVIVWRRNSKYRETRDGGSCYSFNVSRTLKSMTGINGYAYIYKDEASYVLRHEFGHALIGGNNFHTGGAGTGASGHFLPNVGGYSTLHSHNHNLESCNGWDRWRLGWKLPGKTYMISALDSQRNEVNADLVYGEALPTTDFILRDFATRGDAVRIKLPHLNGQVRSQYLWIENHKIDSGSVEYEGNHPQDIRFNIQVGNDDLFDSLDSSRANYFVPLSAFGNYDFMYDTLSDDGQSHENFADRYVAKAYDYTANPFTGNHPAMKPAIDYNNNDTIQAKEFITIKNLFLNGDLKIGTHTVLGNEYDAFHVGSKLSMSTNPPSVPLMTFRTASRPGGNNLGSVLTNHANDDNRYIWLNGLSVEIVEKNDSSIRIRVAWDDFKINSDNRWCGPIMLTERAELQPRKTLTLDYGQTPTRPCNPVVVNNRKVFADPTTFTCLNGSFFKQEPSSTVNVQNLSTLVLEAGSEYEIHDGATLNILNTGTLHIESGATLRIYGTGHLEVHSNGYICIEDGAIIELVDSLSAINLRQGYQLGVNTVGPAPLYTCTSTPLTSYALTSSNGSVHEFEAERYIQDTTYWGNAYETGLSIMAGSHVTTQRPNGDVFLLVGSHVIMDADKEVRLEPGFVVKRGAILEVR